MGLYTPGAGTIDMRAISEVMQPTVAEWYNGVIQIIDPNITGGTYDRIANATTGRNPQVLWTGAARIQAMRWPNVATTRQEAVSLRTVVFHLALSNEPAPELVREGFRVKVLDGGMAPEFEGGLFTVTSAVNTSFAWDRRIETMMDMGVTS